MKLRGLASHRPVHEALGHAKLLAMKVRDDELGMFVVGLLSAMVRDRAFEAAGDMADDEWMRRRHEFLTRAFDDVVSAFPEPLRTSLRAQRDEFVASAIGLN